MPKEWTLAWRDDFLNAQSLHRWIGGRLNTSDECRIEVLDGVRISFVEGNEYASAGLVTREALAGDFAADLDFSVSAPDAGTTFELAAITAAPPALTILDPSSREQCALVFNVHGEPPFVSAEYDEDDGWRMSWNAHPPLYAPLPDGGLMADGRHNVYGRNSGPAPRGAARGALRLVREEGHRWSVWRRDASSEDWLPVPSHRQPEPTLSGPVHLRLAAKHWVKRREGLSIAPANEILFHHFALWQ